MNAQMVVRGIPEVSSALRADVEKVAEASRNVVSKGILIIASNAKRQFRARPGGQKTSKTSGKTYYVFTPPYQAIPPRPTSRSGALQGSIGSFYRVAKTPVGWMGQIGPTVQHAPYVEFGTRYMQKEPYMKTGVDASTDEIYRLIEFEFAKAVA